MIKHLCLTVEFFFFFDAADDVFRERLKQKTFTLFDVFASFVVRAPDLSTLSRRTLYYLYLK